MKKKILSMLAALIFLFQLPAYADENISGGGGGMGDGTGENFWNPGNEGLRVYLVDSSTGIPLGNAVDITNKELGSEWIYGENKPTKYDYKNSTDFEQDDQNNYICTKITVNSLPTIIPESGAGASARIAAIKEWFANSVNQSWVLSQLGTTAEECGKNGYMAGIEPIAYFTYGGKKHALTATETALLNEQTGGDLYNKMRPLTHKNLPLSIFLEHDEFAGTPNAMYAWTGSQTDYVTDSDILNSLGIGCISFAPPPPTEVGEADFEYPTDTWVVTSFPFSGAYFYGGTWRTDEAINADIAFTIDGAEYEMTGVNVKKGAEQRVWVKWKTPAEPCVIPMTVMPSSGCFHNPHGTNTRNQYVSALNVTVKIVERSAENTPPDPTAEDRLETYGWVDTETSDRAREELLGGSDSANESVWTVWRTQLVYYSDGDGGTTSTRYWWVDTYTATVKFVPISGLDTYDLVKITPSEYCKTWVRKNHRTIMGSGYGFEIEARPYLEVTRDHKSRASDNYETTVSSYETAAEGSSFSAPQSVKVYFPEFNYATYDRRLEDVYGDGVFRFKVNKYSPKAENRVHYAPLRYPDDTDYIVVATAAYCYTPVGELKTAVQSNPLYICGNVFDDYYIAPVFD